MDTHGDSENGLDQADCQAMYDHGAEAMSLWAAAHPGKPGLIAGATAIVTHYVGHAVCGSDSGGSVSASPPSYLDDKLGYDPSKEAAPSFSVPSHTNHDTTPDLIPTASLDHSESNHALGSGSHTGFDYSASGHSGSGFDYSATSVSPSGGFSYTPDTSVSSTGGDSSSSSSSNSVHGSTTTDSNGI